MINKLAVLLINLFFFNSLAIGQPQLISRLDSLLNAKADHPFNGVVLISNSDKIIYSTVRGYADFEKKIPLKATDKFVIGSVSKQITAVLVLQAYERKQLNLTDPLSKYLSIPRQWADTVTIHHLLSHTHGIIKLEQALAFKPGSAFMYSQIGYELLAQILEKVTNKSFAELSRDLFIKCNMKNSLHPAYLTKAELVNSFTMQSDGSLKLETKSLDMFVAAGGFISTAADLVAWNQHLFGEKLLTDSTFQLMISAKQNAVRNHPLFGTTQYGYGITLSKEDGLLQLGQTAFVDGFPCMDFYFPDTKTSVIVLQNVSLGDVPFRKIFYFNLEVLKLIREELKKGPPKKTEGLK